MPFSPTGREPIQGVAGQSGPATNTDPTLKLESMLLAEFNYASSTAYQALDDRGRMFSFYLGIAGVLAGLIGLIFFFKIVRIRQAFDDSLLTMNVIKEYYIAKFKDTAPVEKIFRWRLDSMPSGRRFGSLTFLVCLGITLIDSIALGLAAVVITELVTHDANPDFVHLPNNGLIYAVGGAVLAVALLLQIVAYETMLRKKSGKEAMEKAEELGLPPSAGNTGS